MTTLVRRLVFLFPVLRNRVNPSKVWVMAHVQPPDRGTVATYEIGSGDHGTIETLRRMSEIVAESSVDPLVLYTARDIVRGLPVVASRPRARAIREYLTRHFRFQLDPRRRELITRPHTLVDEIKTRGYAEGDCDDAAVLGASLAEAVGLMTRFQVLAFFEYDAPFSHVFTEVATGGGFDPWADCVELDVTKPHQLSAEYTPTRALAYHM